MSGSIPYLGSKISLISKSEIRYEGILYTIDAQESIIALAKVRSFGTEDRPTEMPVPARDEVYEYIIFRGTDIKTIEICDTPKVPSLHNDPAIVQHSAPSVGAVGAPSPAGASGGSSFQQSSFHRQSLGPIGGGIGSGLSFSGSSGGSQLFNSQPIQPSSLIQPGFNLGGSSQPSELEGSNVVGGRVSNIGLSPGTRPGLGGPGPIAPPQTSAHNHSISTQDILADVLGSSRSSTPTALNRKSPVSDAGVQVSPPPAQQIHLHQEKKQLPSRHPNDRSVFDLNFGGRAAGGENGYGGQPRENRGRGRAGQGNQNFQRGDMQHQGYNREFQQRNDQRDYHRGGEREFQRNEHRGDPRNEHRADPRNEHRADPRTEHRGDPRNEHREFNNRQDYQRNENREYYRENLRETQNYQRENQGYQRENQGYQRESQGYQRENQGYQRENQGYQNYYQGGYQGGFYPRNMNPMNRGMRPGRRPGRGSRGTFQGAVGRGGAKQDMSQYEKEFDFEQANEEFEELRTHMSKVKISEKTSENGDAEVVKNGDVEKKEDSGHETATGDESEENGPTICYDKTKSFFDTISCEAVERSKGRSQRPDWRQERKINVQTFGVATARRGYYPRNRGGYYANNRGGYYRNNYGNQGYYGRGGNQNYRGNQRGHSAEGGEQQSQQDRKTTPETAASNTSTPGTSSYASAVRSSNQTATAAVQ